MSIAGHEPRANRPVPFLRRPIRRLAVAMVSPDSYGLVLLLILCTYGFSVTAYGRWASSVVVAVQVAAVWVVLRVSEASRSVRRAAGGFLLLSVAVGVLNVFVNDRDWAEGFILLVSAVLYVIAPISIMRHLMVRREVDAKTVVGAVDAYLLVGMMFAFLYRLLGVSQTAPLFGPGVTQGLPQDLFFSFTTLTTTGYGNLVPAGNPGQSFAVVEMLIGQLFLVTVLAKAVGAYRRNGHSGAAASSKSAEGPVE